MQQLIEAGAHFGHQTHRWNPRMKPYIFGARNGIHILDLSQSVPLFARALEFVSATVQGGGKVLFVGTKRQAQEPIAQAARASGQHYVNHRWLGGMLTNWKTISGSIKRFKALEEQLSGDTTGLTKKEVLQLTRERDKFELSLGGIRDMGGIPDVMFVIDANKEELRSRKPTSSASRSWRSSIRTSRPMASLSRFRRTMTPAAPSASTARPLPQPPRAAAAMPRSHRAPTLVRWTSRLPKRRSKSPSRPTPELAGSR
jgi:ribosomal protein S2